MDLSDKQEGITSCSLLTAEILCNSRTGHCGPDCRSGISRKSSRSFSKTHRRGKACSFALSEKLHSLFSLWGTAGPNWRHLTSSFSPHGIAPCKKKRKVEQSLIFWGYAFPVPSCGAGFEDSAFYISSTLMQIYKMYWRISTFGRIKQ